MPSGIKGFQKGNKINLKHGHLKNGKMTKTYPAWKHMRSRCNNPNNPSYEDYGGRGITICKRWDKFIDFLADMSERPGGLMLDRIDNNGNYEPDNCRWTDVTTSNRNSRNNKLSLQKANKIRELYSWGFRKYEIAKHFNISWQLVNFVIKGKIWN